MTDNLILAIESSCDETAAAVVKNGRHVLSNIIFSQVDLHKKFGGVVPEIASRNHTVKIDCVVEEALEKAGVGLSEIDAVAVTYGPGLVGALLVGLSFAKALAYCAKKPLIGVHHIEGHICANYLENEGFKPPFVCLVVSGGHTHLVHVSDYSKYEILGRTKDDAAGEAYDKVARTLGLPYPGGVEIDRLSKEGNPNAIKFPRAGLEAGSLDFSFSGLKSAVLNYVNSANMQGLEINRADVAASFQQAVVDVLVSKSVLACKQKGVFTLALAGGVSSNSCLRSQMQAACQRENIAFQAPPLVYCTDNAAMIAACAYYSIGGMSSPLSLNAHANAGIGMLV